MLTQGEKTQIRQLIQSPQWGAIEHLISDLCDKIKYESKLRDTEWDTLKTTVFDEGQVYGIQRLSKETLNTQL